MTQSQIIINALRASGSRGMTYGELLGLKVSTCPWKRAREGDKHLKAGEQIDRYEGEDGLTRIRIINILNMHDCKFEGDVTTIFGVEGTV